MLHDWTKHPDMHTCFTGKKSLENNHSHAQIKQNLFPSFDVMWFIKLSAL